MKGVVWHGSGTVLLVLLRRTLLVDGSSLDSPTVVIVLIAIPQRGPLKGGKLAGTSRLSRLHPPCLTETGHRWLRQRQAQRFSYCTRKLFTTLISSYIFLKRECSPNGLKRGASPAERGADQPHFPAPAVHANRGKQRRVVIGI